ncbi:MAG: helix-turn-helix transcriptional regulator [Alkalispirochaetaceae bacterium]
MATKSQYNRLLYIDRQIRSGRYPNAPDLARGYEVSERTIKRDVEWLRDFQGAPIAYSAKHRGYYYEDPDFRLSDFVLSEGELFALAVGEELLAHYENTPEYATLKRVFAKLTEMLPEKVSVADEFLSSRVTVMNRPRTVISERVWKLLLSAMREERQLSIRYRSVSSGVRERLLSPYHILGHGGEWYVVGHDSRHQETRVFAVSRIENAELTDHPYELPQEFEIERYVDPDFGVFMHDREEQVILRFRPEVAPYIRERQWHRNQELKERSDGTVELRFKTNQLESVQHWVQSWGGGCEVIAPQSLRIRVAAILRATLEQYQDVLSRNA